MVLTKPPAPLFPLHHKQCLRATGRVVLLIPQHPPSRCRKAVTPPNATCRHLTPPLLSDLRGRPLPRFKPINGGEDGDPAPPTASGAPAFKPFAWETGGLFWMSP